MRVVQAGGHEKKNSKDFNPRSSDLSSSSSIGSNGSSSFDIPDKNRTGHCFGSALFEVGDILGGRNYTKVKRLKGGGW